MDEASVLIAGGYKYLEAVKQEVSGEIFLICVFECACVIYNLPAHVCVCVRSHRRQLTHFGS